MEERREWILSHEHSLRMLQGLPISDEESLRRRDQIIEDFQEKCVVKREEYKVSIEIPDWDLSFIQKVKTAQQRLEKVLEKTVSDYKKEGDIVVVFSGNRNHVPEKIDSVMKQEKEMSEYSTEFSDNSPVAA